jgi:putative ABC transport system permease protein
MFLRLIADNFTRRPRRKLLTAVALSLGMAVATAALSVSLDVGDRLAQEFRSLGANLVVTPEADSLPLEIGGVDFRPANSGAYLPEADLSKIKTVFWHNNITGFAPILDSRTILHFAVDPPNANYKAQIDSGSEVPVIGTWANHRLPLPDGGAFLTGVDKTNPWWNLTGKWFQDGANECVLGQKLAQRENLKIGSQIDLQGGELAPRTRAQIDDESALVTIRSNTRLVVTGILESGGPEDDAVVVPLEVAQQLASRPGQYRKLYISALTKPEDDFARRDPRSMKPD